MYFLTRAQVPAPEWTITVPLAAQTLKRLLLVFFSFLTESDPFSAGEGRDVVGVGGSMSGDVA